MKTVEIGAFEAKTHFSEILRKTSLGTEFIILLRGNPVAELKAIKGSDGREKAMSALDRISTWRSSVKPMALDEIVSLAHEGRER